jgi:hypothetical protein
MNDYQEEQLQGLVMVGDHLRTLDADQRSGLHQAIEPYKYFRKEVDGFLKAHFDALCTTTCYQDQRSACCSKDGIITFFADHVVNALNSSADQLEALKARLQRTNTSGKCVYLTPQGCCWRVRPLVCAMFLCDRAQDTIFSDQPELKPEWEHLQMAAKGFRWPERPVLFDALEIAFMDAGYTSSLMYLNFSPGLLRIKQNAGLPVRTPLQVATKI